MNYLLFEILVCFLYPLPILSYKISLITFRMALVHYNVFKTYFSNKYSMFINLLLM